MLYQNVAKLMLTGHSFYHLLRISIENKAFLCYSVTIMNPVWHIFGYYTELFRLCKDTGLSTDQ